MSPPTEELAPAMRAHTTLSLLRAAEHSLAPAALVQVMAAMEQGTAEEVRARIENARSLSWNPMSFHMAFADQLRLAHGPGDKNVQLWQHTAEHIFGEGFLAKAVEVSKRLLGPTPLASLKIMRRMYAHTTRGLGIIDFGELREGLATVDFYGFPASEFDFECYVEGVGGCLLGSATMFSSTANLEILNWTPSGEAKYRLTW